MNDKNIFRVDPVLQTPLIKSENFLINEKKEKVAEIIDDIPRFVPVIKNYSESFGWQWNKWEDIRSNERGGWNELENLIIKRTNFDKFNLEGKTILECGMGGGDDTEILLKLPFKEIHAFDISNSVERAKKKLQDDRLVISQASILDIPYKDNEFDFVFCHRVLQHTPNPAESLKSICKKVKPGGILFAHAYKRSFRNMMEWRYKYRWFTKHLPYKKIYKFVDKHGKLLHSINWRLYKYSITRFFAYNFIPFYYKTPIIHSIEKHIELEKLITFDALTPKHDHPMTSKDFFKTIEEEGFEILYKHDPKISPLWCTARKIQ